MTRSRAPGAPTQKNPRRNPARDHSPDDRRHGHPAHTPGADEAREVEHHHRKR